MNNDDSVENCCCLLDSLQLCYMFVSSDLTAVPLFDHFPIQLFVQYNGQLDVSAWPWSKW